MSENSAGTVTNQDELITANAPANKMPVGKLIGMAVLMCAILAGNYFFNHAGKKSEEKKNIETYDIASPERTSSMASAKTDNNPIADPAQTEKQLQRELAEAKAKDFIERLQASQNTSGGSSNYGTASASVSSVGNDGAGNTAANQYDNPNSAFQAQASKESVDRAYAVPIGSLSMLIGQGKFIFGTLRVAMDSDLPGEITAIVSQDVFGERGRTILIPKGSRLNGEYRSGLLLNQSRLFVVWTSVTTPNGIRVMLGSGGADALGRAGLTGDVNNHYLARFGSATLIALIGAGASTVNVGTNDQYNSLAAYRQEITQALSQESNIVLSQSMNIPPTIKIHQGQPVVVFVHRDLDFSRVYG
jgi:type IV secretion system protein VirB10